MEWLASQLVNHILLLIIKTNEPAETETKSLIFEKYPCSTVMKSVYSTMCSVTKINGSKYPNTKLHFTFKYLAI